jgi:protoporphyrinogen oxidase
MRFIVLGAGLSGLACAVALTKAGHDVCVVEKESEVGGLARSHRVNGHVFDYGPHFLFGQKAYQLVQQEFPKVALTTVSSTKEKMFFRDKFFKFPFDPKNILLNMERRQVPATLAELAIRRLVNRRQSEENEDLEKWVIDAVGRRIYDYISLGGYIRKLYGLPATRISHEWGLQKLRFLARWRNTNLFRLAGQSFVERGKVAKRSIHYPTGGGIDLLPVQMSADFSALGGKLVLNAEVVGIEHGSERVSLYMRENGRRAQLEGDFLVSTIPITTLIDMLVPAVSPGVRNRCRLLRYRVLRLLCFEIRRQWLLKDQCIYFTEDQFFFRRITEFKHLSPRMATEKGTALCVEMTCFENDAIDKMSQRELEDVVVRQLTEEGYLRPGDIVGCHCLRLPFAYPVYELENAGALGEVLDSLERYERLLTIGRQGLFHYNAMNSSLLTATALGRRLAFAGDRDLPSIARETYRNRREKYQKT